jgi:F-type H+-transporting ATPase subunit a
MALKTLFFTLFISTFLVANPSEKDEKTKKEEKFNPVETIMHHIADSHEWHLMGEGESSITLPLPVILYTDNGLVTFLSSQFHHDDEGKVVVEKNGSKFIKVHDKIYFASESAHEGSFVQHSEDKHSVLNKKPLDFSITKVVAGMFLSAILLVLIFGAVGMNYSNGNRIPKGLAKFMEPIIVFVRDDIAIPNIGKKKYKKYLPYLMTLFFFIWINNLMGLIPGSANVTGNIAITFTLAFFTLFMVNINAKSTYWKHLVNPLGNSMPWAGKLPVYLILVPVELLGIITKPFALMVRLFANITAGHIIILSLVSLIFIFETVAMAPVSIALTLFINTLELLVAALQAYIFTLLTALFIGMAIEDHHEEAH